LTARRAEVEEQARRLGDLQGDLDRREAALAAGQSGVDERTAKLENDLRHHAETVAGFQRSTAQAEARRQAQLAEEESRLEAAAVVVNPSPLGEDGPGKKRASEGLRPTTAPVEEPVAVLDPASPFVADMLQDLQEAAADVAKIRAPARPSPIAPPRAATPAGQAKSRPWSTGLLLIAALAAVAVVAAIVIFVYPGRGGNTSAPPAGPVRVPAAAPAATSDRPAQTAVAVSPSPLGEGGPASGPGEGLRPTPAPSAVAAPPIAPRSASAPQPAVVPPPAVIASVPQVKSAPAAAKPLIPGGVWPFKPPADLTDDKPADDLRATRAWAGDELAKTISELRQAYDLRADAGPRQAIAVELDDRLKATLNDFRPPPYAAETLPGGEPEHVTILVFLEFLYKGNTYLVVFKRLDQTGAVVLGRRGTFTLNPGAIRDHTVVLDPTRAPIPEPARTN
jgi:hypothetical protein